MIPDSRPPNIKEFDRVFAVMCDKSDLVTDMLRDNGVTDVTGEDVLRCIINDWPKE